MISPHNIKLEANQRERKQAQALGMERCPMSGAGAFKGDLRNDLALIDSKFTYADTQITIKRKDLQKIDLEAMDYNPPRIPALLISINGFERMVIPVEDFQCYLELKRREINGKTYE